MVRFYEKAGWLLSSLGIALLVISTVLVPQNRALADDGDDILLAPCPVACDNGCLGPLPCSSTQNRCRQITVAVCMPCGCYSDPSTGYTTCLCQQ